MDDSLTLPERSISRSSDQVSQGNEQDLFTYHQGETARQLWDPYSFHQGSIRVGDTIPSPRPEPEYPAPDLPFPRPDMPQPRPDIPLPVPQVREIRLPDGALNVIDAQGRVILTASADGRCSRAVEYGDPSDPYKVTRVVVDQNKVYTRIGNSTCWSMEFSGRQSGTWRGEVRMSPNGEYSIEDYCNGERRFFGPNTKEIIDGRTVHARRGASCNTGGCSTYDRSTYDRSQNEWGRYNQTQTRYYDDRSYYDDRRYDNRYYEDRRYYDDRRYDSRYYPQPGYDDRYQQNCYPQRNCAPRYDNRYHHNNNIGAQIGLSVLNGVIGSAMMRNGYGYHRYGGGYYGGGYYGGGCYGGGNIAGAVIGNVIGRAIMGGGRHCR